MEKNLCWLLIKNRLTKQLGIHILRYEKDARKRRNRIMLNTSILIILLVLLGYSSVAAYGLAMLGFVKIIPPIAVVISSFLTLFFTIFKANGELFKIPDYDFLMSLPIPVQTVINSRFLNMYVWNTLLVAGVMLPMGMVYGIFMKASVGYYAIWVLGIFLVSLIPTTIAAFLGALVIAIASRFKHTSAVATILSITVVVILLIGLTTMGNMSSGSNDFTKHIKVESGTLDREIFTELAPKVLPQISSQIYQIYPPGKLFVNGVVGGDIFSFLLFAGISIGWYVIFIFGMSLKYREINSILTSQHSESNYKLQVLHQSSMVIALYKKTILRILRSTICATNLLIGCIMAIVLAIAIVIIGPKAMLKSLNAIEYLHMVKSIAPFVIAGMVCMTNTTSISLALEGKTIWLIKSLPINPKKLYDSYLLTNFTFTIPTALFCATAFSISLKTNVVGTLLLFLTPISFAIFTSVMGIFVGNRMAYYNWEEDAQLVKQSGISMIGILGSMIFIGICGVIVNSGVISWNKNVMTFGLNILVLILAIVIYQREFTRPIKE